MGKSTKPTNWFKAVKKAFRSPSKERPPSPGNTKGDADEKLLTKHDFPPVSHQAPTLHPLPLFEIISHEIEPERTQGQPLPTPEAVLDPAVPAIYPEREEKEVQEEDVNASSNVLPVVETHPDGDDDSTLSEEEEAATRIQQRFSSPQALKGLLRLQALVRGHLVRRQAATTLCTMEAIVRVQAVFRGRRVRMSKDGRAVRSRISRTRRHSSRNGVVHMDKLEPLGSEFEPEEANKRKRPTAYLLTQQLKRNTSNQSSSFIDCDSNQPHGGWDWLELWTNARPWENHRQLEDSKDYVIEIIPSSDKNTQHTTKEVDVNTLEVKYYEGYISNSTPTKTSFSARPLSENLKERRRVDISDWQPTPRAPSPVQISAPPGSSTMTAHSHQRVLSKPPPIEVPGTEEDEVTQKLRTPDSARKPLGGELNLTPPSPAVSEDAASPKIVPSSPQASDAASVSVPETPPDQLDPGGSHDPSMTTEQLVLPEAHRTHGEEVNRAALTHSDSLSVSNEVHQPGEVTPSHKGSASDYVVNGHTSNDRQENGDNKARKGEKVGEQGESPQLPSKRTTCRYMAATESAKAKFRSSSNPKTRSTTPETPESPGESTPKRYSIGGTGTPVSKAAESPKTAFGTRKSNSFQNRRSPSPKPGVVFKAEKPRSVDISPARRNSLGGADGKRWRT